MKRDLRNDAQKIIAQAIQAVQPAAAVHNALDGRAFPGRVILVSVGKAAWQMAHAAHECLGERIDSGIIITKYGHAHGDVAGYLCFEAGHPIPDENSFRATQTAIDLVKNLSREDTVIFLLSGGGSALFEQPLIPKEELQNITAQLLACGADIVECNTIRKRLSAVKGGRFALLCAPAKVFSIILSDVLGDPLDMIASGPAYPDQTTCEQAIAIADKYHLALSFEAKALLAEETPKYLDNIETYVTGSVKELCLAAARACGELGYKPLILTDLLCCQAKEAGAFLASIARSNANSSQNLAFLAGGETVVQLTGHGKGGRNQELALAAAEGISGIDNVVLFSLASDGGDGPTDAAGGIVDGGSAKKLSELGIKSHQVLSENNSYWALEKIDGLLKTGSTGTNVNDVAVVLIRQK